MPDPIVIIGPASGPAGPIAGPPAPPNENPDASADETQGPAAPQPSALKQTTGRIAALAARGAWAALVITARGAGRMAVLAVHGSSAGFWALARLIQQYPRYSLAAGASFLILGSIAYTQSGTGDGRRGPVTTAITGGLSKPAAATAKAGAVGSGSAAAGKSGTADSESGNSIAGDTSKQRPDAGPHPADAGNIARADSPDAASPAGLPALPAGLPAPKPSGAGEEIGPGPALAEGPPPSAQRAATDPAGAGDAMREAPFDPVPPPPSAGESGVATLLGGTPDAAPRPAHDKQESATAAGPAKPTPTAKAIMPAPTPVDTRPVPPAQSPTISSPAAEPVLPLSPAGPAREAATGSQNSAADAHAKEAKPEKEKKTEPVIGPLGQAPPSEPPKASEENPPAVPTPVQNPSASPELHANPAAGSATTKSQPITDEQKSLDLSHGGAPDLSSPALAPQTPRGETDDSRAKAAPPAPAHELPAPAHEAVNPPTEDPTPRREPPPARRDTSAPGIETPAVSGATGTRPASGSAVPHADERAGGADEPGPRTTSASPGDTPPPPARRRQLADGWIEIPNSGGLTSANKPDLDQGAMSAESSGAPESGEPRDRRAHAAKDMVFEPESVPIRTRAGASRDPAPAGGALSPGFVSGSEPKPNADYGKVEAVPHVVESKENFYTISQLYYSSGKYYRALWKANAARYPDINVLHVGDVIVVPPVEDLDPAYIVSSRKLAGAGIAENSRARATARDADSGAGGTGLADGSESTSGPAESATNTARRTRAVGSTGRVASRRASITDPALDLPPAESMVRRDRPPGRAGRPASDDDTESDQPETRYAARPRAMGAAPPTRPAYKVRPYDTLRSIARDTLGDARRADEILDLNRAVIDDPSQLIVGQLLELPEDARTSVRRSVRSR
jgi:hypothetical protein